MTPLVIGPGLQRRGPSIVPMEVSIPLSSALGRLGPVVVETVYAEPKPAGPLKVSLIVNGKLFASGVVPVSAPLTFTANDCLDIGIALGSPVSLDYREKAPFKFNGNICKVNVKYIPEPTI